MRLMASHGLLGPLATVEATIGANESTITAPSNTYIQHTNTHAQSSKQLNKRNLRHSIHMILNLNIISFVISILLDFRHSEYAHQAV